MAKESSNINSAGNNDSQYIEWKESYSVGVERLDEDHKHLLAILNKACEACAKGRYTAYPLIIDELLEYMLLHFQAEEKYMTESKFPDLAPHKLEHDLFYRKILDYQQTIQNRNVVYSIELVDLTEAINNWWDRHILESDLRYKVFADGFPQGAPERDN